VHQETVLIVDAQMADVSKQMGALDDFVAKARSHNGRFHESHMSSLDTIANNVRESRTAMKGQLDGFGERVSQLQEDTNMHTEELEQSTAPLQDGVRQPLVDLRANIQSHPMKEYVPTGVTPQKRRYDYPSTLPRTEPHEGLRSRHRVSKQFTALPFSEEPLPPPLPESPAASPSKSYVYSDAAEEVTHPSSSFATTSNTGLKEVDINITRPVTSGADDDTVSACKTETPAAPPVMELDETPAKDESEPPRKRRRSASTNPVECKLPQKRLSKKMAGMMEGRENVPPPSTAGRRYLRTRPSD